MESSSLVQKNLRGQLRNIGTTAALCWFDQLEPNSVEVEIYVLDFVLDVELC